MSSEKEHGRRQRKDWRQKDSPREKKQQNSLNVTDSDSPVIRLFLDYQKELDHKHDKYERLVKLSRDVTIESKRTIFLLQRITGNEEKKAEILLEAAQKLEQIEKEKFERIAVELYGEDPYQFLRAYSPGLQEYIEALSFYWYWKNGELVNLNKVEKTLQFQVEKPQDETDDSNNSEQNGETVTKDVTVPPIEYILGVADLTGELMRCAIHSVGNGDLNKPFEICGFLRQIHDAFLSYGNVARELPRKMSTLRASLRKVEQACYTLQVRGSEFPQHMLVDILSKPFDNNDYNDEYYD